MADRTLTVSEAQRALPELVERARRGGESTVLVQDGIPVARVVPIERPFERPRRTGAELAAAWERRPRLDPDDAEVFAADIERG